MFIKLRSQVFLIFVFCVLIFIRKAFCLKSLNYGKILGRNSTEQAVNKKNPWEEYMKIFDIAKNHNSGVINDLGGSVVDVDVKFPDGKCPVFGKIIHLNNKYRFSDDANLANFEKEWLWPILKDGSISTPFNYDMGLNFPTKILGNFFPQFEKLNSPSQQDSIYQCAAYANKFEHIVVSRENLNNCFSAKNQTCIKHPFIYNLKTKQCFILLPLLQTYVHHATRTNVYYPTKEINNSHFVFGTSSIGKNWPQLCPVKPIKGALFGLWKNGVCKKIEKSKVKTFYNCSQDLFRYSRNDIKILNTYPNSPKMDVDWANWTNWANWEEGKCEIIDTKPDCLYRSDEGFALTSLGIHSEKIYDLPPCILGVSDEWAVRASCNGIRNKVFTCSNGKWVTDTGEQITKCESEESWANLDIPDLSHHKQHGTTDPPDLSHHKQHGTSDPPDLSHHKQHDTTDPPDLSHHKQHGAESGKIGAFTDFHCSFIILTVVFTVVISFF